MQFFSLLRYGNKKRAIPHLEASLWVPNKTTAFAHVLHSPTTPGLVFLFDLFNLSFSLGVSEVRDKEQLDQRLAGEGRELWRKLASDAITEHRLNIESKKKKTVGADLSLWKEFIFFQTCSQMAGERGRAEKDEEGIVIETCPGVHV